MRFFIRNGGLYLMNYDLSRNSFQWSSCKWDAVFTTENGVRVLLTHIHNNGYWNACAESV